MAQTCSCTVVGQNHNSGTMGEFKTNAAAYVGKSGNYFYTYFMKFEVPEFSGIPGEIRFGLCFSSSYSSGHTFRAAIVSSLDNFKRYTKSNGPVGEVEDEFQVAVGMTPTFSGVNSVPRPYTFSLDGSKLSAGKTYYLILWASTAVGMLVQSTVNGYGDATAVLTYEPGAVRLDTGENVVMGMVYLDNGQELLLAIPWVDTGSEWVIGA